MYIIRLKYLMDRQVLRRGTTFAFLNDLRKSNSRIFSNSNKLRYMVTHAGIMDLNGAYDVIEPTKSLLNMEVLVLEEK